MKAKDLKEEERWAFRVLRHKDFHFTEMDLE